MYNRYIPNGSSYTRITEEDAPSPIQGRPRSPPPSRTLPLPARRRRPTKSTPAKHSGALSALLKKLKLEDLDTGDVLLLLILLFLFLEGDDLELVITLGLLLVLGLE